MVLGAYYLTIFREGAKGEGRRFISFDEARLAYFNKDIALQAKIKVRVPNSEIYPEPSDVGESLVTTSMGNIIYNCELPLEMRYYSKQEDGTWLLGKLIDKKELGRLVAKAISFTGTSARPASLIRSRNSVMTTLVCPVCPLPRRISKFRRKRAKSLLLLKKKSIRSNASSAVG